MATIAPAKATIPTATAMPAGSQTALPLHVLDVETYNAIVASGALEGRNVELLDGVLVEMSPQGPAHAQAIILLTRLFASASAWLMVQLPLEVAPDSQPEPDIALLARRPPPGRHPRTALLVIEVAVTSQIIDRDVKGPLYARAGVPTCWLIDLPARTVEVYTQPSDHGYARCERHRADAKLACGLPGVPEIDLAALFDDLAA